MFSISSLLTRFAKTRSSVVLLGVLALGLPASALSLQFATWYSQWTNGAALSASGESIGSLPCYFTSAEVAAVPGMSPNQLAMQTMPALQLDIAPTQVFSAFSSSVGNGYVFIGPSLTSEANARVRVFGSASSVLDPKLFAVRTNSLSWRVGSTFAGSTLVFSAMGKPSVVQLAPATSDVPLPIDSPIWSSILANGPLTLTLIRADGVTATLQLALVNGQLTAVQTMP